MSNIAGIAVSLLYIAIVLGAAFGLQKAGLKNEGTRKLVHIGLGGWWGIAMVFFSSPLWAAAVPLVFVLANAFALRRGLLGFISRGGGSDTPGTVYYAASLALLALGSFGRLGAPYIGALGVGCLALGDGSAAIAGSRAGNNARRLAGGKTLRGTACMFLFSLMACWVILATFAPGQKAFVPAFLLAAGAAGLELFSQNGLDNLTVPLYVSAGYYVLFYPAAAPMAQSVLAGAMLSGLVALAAVQKGLLTRPAAVGALCAGTLVWLLGGWPLWAVMMWFFASSNLAARLLAGRLGTRRKKSEGPRRLVQVLANSVPALLCASGYFFSDTPWLLLAAFGAFAACTADTWASEIGVYSRREPVNILTGKRMQRGLSGGVSPLGLCASFAGALTSALLAMLLIRLAALGVPTTPAAFLLILACGCAGSLIDSVLGVCLQAKYRCATDASLVETPSGSCTLVSGRAWANNDMVNLLSGLAAALLALPLAAF